MTGHGRGHETFPQLRSPAEVPRLLNIDQVAVHLGVTTRHIRRLVSERRIPYLKVGRFVRFDPAAVGVWLDGARREPGDFWQGVARRHTGSVR
ncbi:MAG: helix-turn-helix domain-containing protein [Actinomycetota bacterium]|nr:helix-turn-helix domain-containing protein [Actinomycetota bacterium]